MICVILLSGILSGIRGHAVRPPVLDPGQVATSRNVSVLVSRNPPGSIATSRNVSVLVSTGEPGSRVTSRQVSALVATSVPGTVATSRNVSTLVSPVGGVTSRNVSLIAQPVPPTSFNVRRGRVNSGNVASLASKDFDYLEVCKFFVVNQSEPPVNVEVDTTNPSNSLSALSFRFYAKVTTSGNFQVTLDLFNWTQNQFDSTDIRVGTLNTSLAEVVVSASGDVSRYMNASKVIRARFRVKPLGPIGSASWCVDTDQAVFLIQP